MGSGKRKSVGDVSHLMDSLEVVEQRREFVEAIGIRTVAERMVRVLVDFHEHRVDSDCGRRTRQRRDEFALSA